MPMLKKSVIKAIKIYGDFFGIGDVADIEELLVGCRYDYKDVLEKLKTIDTTHYFTRITREEVAKAIVALGLGYVSFILFEKISFHV